VHYCAAWVAQQAESADQVHQRRDGEPGAQRCASFFWVSRPETRHSRNLAARHIASIVIFDSTVPEIRTQAVYVQASAEELGGAERDDAIAIFSRRSLALGLRDWRTADVVAPAPHRLYRARPSDCYILGPNDERQPVKIGGNEPA
jgi:hypothetical protein